MKSYIKREEGESAEAFLARVMADSRLLPDQRHSLQQETPSRLDKYIKGLFLEDKK